MQPLLTTGAKVGDGAGKSKVALNDLRATSASMFDEEADDPTSKDIGDTLSNAEPNADSLIENK